MMCQCSVESMTIIGRKEPHDVLEAQWCYKSEVLNFNYSSNFKDMIERGNRCTN